MAVTQMFAVDVRGMQELEGGRDPAALAAEAVVNVFDEYRLRCPEARPSFCGVTLEKSDNPRGVRLAVEDDGQGFDRIADVWTLFGTTAKRSDAGVSGRFNLGEKQLVAAAIEATVESNQTRVRFAKGRRTVSAFAGRRGVRIEAVMPWRVGDIDAVRDHLLAMRPPQGLRLIVSGQVVESKPPRCRVSVTLPTVALSDGVMRPTTRRTTVDVVEPGPAGPMLMELGSPVCPLDEIGFCWSIDVGQKVPVPPTRDSVRPAYLHRLIGLVLEQATLNGHNLIGQEQQGAGFLRDALDHVKDEAALAETVKAVYGANAVRQSSDGVANGEAAESGATVIPGRWFTPATRQRLDRCGALPVSSTVYGGSPARQARLDQAQAMIDDAARKGVCPTCRQPVK